jgi:hypothetical protein
MTASPKTPPPELILLAIVRLRAKGRPSEIAT